MAQRPGFYSGILVSPTSSEIAIGIEWPTRRRNRPEIQRRDKEGNDVFTKQKNAADAWLVEDAAIRAVPTGVAFRCIAVSGLGKLRSETFMTFSQETNDLARSLLAYESAGDASDPTQSLAVRVCEKLREPLCALAGVASYRSVLTRALTLARTEAPSLSALEVTADGKIQRTQGDTSPIDKDHPSEEDALLTSRFIELFLTLLGAAVTLRLVQEVFPNLMVTTESGTLTAFGDILKEVGYLNSVSDRLVLLADQNPSVEEALMSVSGNIRSTATTLELVALIKTQNEELQKKLEKQQRDRYLM